MTFAYEGWKEVVVALQEFIAYLKEKPKETEGTETDPTPQSTPTRPM